MKRRLLAGILTTIILALNTVNGYAENIGDVEKVSNVENAGSIESISSIDEEIISDDIGFISDDIELVSEAGDLTYEGGGSEENPFLIKTAEQFIGIAEHEIEGYSENKTYYYKVANDIDFSTTPIEKYSTLYRKCVIDGNEKTLSNLKFIADGQTVKTAHLFDISSRSVTVKNIIFNNIDFKYTGDGTSGPSMYAIFGNVNVGGSLENITVSGKVNVDFGESTGFYKGFGGIAYQLYGANVKDCTVDADITFASNGNIGGLAYTVYQSNITNYKFQGTIKKSGYIYDSHVSLLAPTISDTSVENSNIEGAVSGISYVYGLGENASYTNAGDYKISNITISTDFGNDYGARENIGLFGKLNSSGNTNIAITECRVAKEAKMHAGLCVGLINEIGGDGNVEISNCNNYADITLSEGTVYGLINKINFEYSSQAYNSEIVIKNCTNEGNINTGTYSTTSSSTAAGLIGEITANKNKKVSVLSCVNKGIITGGQIAGLIYQIGESSPSAGKIDDFYNNILIKDCDNKAEKLLATRNAGGCFNQASYGIVENCNNEAIIELNSGSSISMSSAAGLVLQINNILGNTDNKYITFKKCSNSGDISGIYTGFEFAAGLSNRMYAGRIFECYNTGIITGGRVGGLIGSMQGGYISSCYNEGNINANTKYTYAEAGGVVHELYASAMQSVINNTYNKGNITIRHRNTDDLNAIVGGIVGQVIGRTKYNRFIVNSYNAGAIEGYLHQGDRVGAFVGKADANETITASGLYYLNSVKDITNGSNEWKGDGADDVINAVALSESKMKDQDSFAGYNFAKIWEYRDGEYKYPVLKGYEEKFVEPKATTKIIYTYGSKTVDITKTTHRIEQSHEAFNITVDSSDKANIKEYGLCDNHYTIVIRNTTGKFINVSPKKFTGKEPVYVYIKDKTNHVQYIKTFLYIDEVKTPVISKVNFSGANIGFHLTEDVPILGGQDYSLNLPASLPVSVVVDHGLVKVGINICEGKLYDGPDGVDDDDKVDVSLKGLKKEKLRKQYDEYVKNIKDSNKIVKDFRGTLEQIDFESKVPMWEKNVKLNVVGYAQGEYSDTLDKLTGELYVEIVASGEIEKQTAVTLGMLVIPIYLDLNGTGKGAGDAKLTYKIPQQEWAGDLGADFGLTLDGYAAAGIGKYISIGPYGNLTVNVDTTIMATAPKTPGLDEVGLKGSIGVRGYFAKKKVDDYEIVSLKKLGEIPSLEPHIAGDKLLIYTDPTEPRDDEKTGLIPPKTKSASAPNKSAKNPALEQYFDLISDTERLDQMTEEDLDDVVEMVGASDDVYIENCYADASPKLVKVGDELMMVYIGIKDGDTALYYAIYDEENKEFGTPKLIDDDNTSDYKFSVVSDKNDLWVCYQDSNNTNVSGMSLSDYAKTFGISVAKYDMASDRFNVKSEVGADNCYCFNPQADIINDELMISWVENSAGNIFGLESKNVIKLAALNGGEAEETIVAENVNAVTALAVGNIGLKPYVAYIESADNELSSSDEDRIVLYDVEAKSSKSANTKASYISFAKLPSTERNVLCANIDGGLAAFDDSLISTMVSDAGIFGSNEEFSIDNDTIYSISYPSNNVSNVVSIKYVDDKYCAVCLTDESEYVESVSAKDGVVVYMSNAVDMSSYENPASEDEIETVGHIKVLTNAEKEALSAENIYYDGEQILPSGELFVEALVSNEGTKAINSVTAQLCDAATDDVIDEVIINESLAPGQAFDAGALFELLDSISDSGYYVVYLAGGAKSDALPIDVKAEITTYGEYVITEEGKIIKTYVENVGAVSTTVNSALKDSTGNTLASNSDELAAGEVLEYELSLDEENMPSAGEEGLFTFIASASRDEYYLDNNTCAIRVWNDDIKEVEIAEAGSEIYGDASVTIDRAVITVNEGETVTINATAIDKFANVVDNPTLIWSSEDESVAKVSNGKVSGLKVGTTNIYVNYNGKMDSAKVYVVRDEKMVPDDGNKPDDGGKDDSNKSDDGAKAYLAMKEIKEDGSYVLNLATKQKFAVSELAKVKADGKNYKIEYANKTDKKYATINKKGIIAAKKPGTSNIIITKGTSTIKVTVNVYEPKFSQKKYAMKVGEKLIPEFTSCGFKVVFSIADKQKKFASINPETGELTALAKGTVTVSAIIGEGRNAKKITTKVKILK